MATVALRNYRQAPRKVRLVADLIRGQQVDRALTTLEFAGKRAAFPIKKLLCAGIAAAKESGKTLAREDLCVESIRVDKGLTYKRMRPRARGRGAAIHKETCHIVLTIGQDDGNRKQEIGNRKQRGRRGTKIVTPIPNS